MNNSYYLHNDSRLNQALGPWFTHEYINYFSILPHEWLISKEKIVVSGKPDYEKWKIGPNHEEIYKESAEAIRNMDRFQAHDISLKNSDFSTIIPQGKKIEPWKIIINYCTIPDLDLDCDLELHTAQKITGGSHGYRHMQYKLFGKKIGVTSDCFTFFYKKTLKSFNEGEQYWGYRFLSLATHYLADLGHPFHMKLFPFSKIPFFLTKLKDFRKYLTAAHNGHEVYTQFRFRQEFSQFKHSIVKGSQEGYENREKSNILNELRKFRKETVNSLKPMFNAIVDNFTPDLIKCYNIESLNTEEQELDYSKQCMLLEENVQKELFKNEEDPALSKLDDLTAKALERVGFMLGLLYGNIEEFLP